MIEISVNLFLLTMLAATGLLVVRLKNLFTVAMVTGIYSLLSAVFFTLLDAVDVAFTEAAVGAGVSTVLILGTLSLVGHQQKEHKTVQIVPLVIVTITGLLLMYGTLDIPPFGKGDNPIHQHETTVHYLEESSHETGMPNVVTSILASYRGYDTFGETTVIFTAMVGVLLLMSGRKGKGSDCKEGDRDGR